MEAIGLLETKGLVGALDAVDSMMKSARVSLLKKEITGGGLVTVVVSGMVADVRAAIDVGAAVCEGRGCLVSSHVIARASGGVEYLLHSVAEAYTQVLPEEQTPPETPEEKAQPETPEEKAQPETPEPAEEEAPPETPKPPQEEETQEAPEEEAQPQPPTVVRGSNGKSKAKNSYTRDYLTPLSIKQLRRLLKADNSGEAEGASVEFLSKAALIKELMKNSINEEEAN